MRTMMAVLALGALCPALAARAEEAEKPSPAELVTRLGARRYAERSAAFDALLVRLAESEVALAAGDARLGKLLAAREDEEEEDASEVIEAGGKKYYRRSLERERESIRCLLAELEAGRGWTRGVGEGIDLKGGVNVQVAKGSFDDFLPFVSQALGVEVALSPAAKRAVANTDLSVTGWATGAKLLEWIEADFDLLPGMKAGGVVLRPKAASSTPVTTAEKGD